MPTVRNRAAAAYNAPTHLPETATSRQPIKGTRNSAASASPARRPQPATRTAQQERDHFASQLAVQHLEATQESEHKENLLRQRDCQILALQAHIDELENRSQIGCTPCTKFWFMTAAVALTALSLLGYKMYQIYTNPAGSALALAETAADQAEALLQERISGVVGQLWPF